MSEPRAGGATALPEPSPSAASGSPAPAVPSRRRTAPGRRARRAWRIVAVGGGKGGIGKSLISASLGIELARAGNRVVLIDADLGGANLHTCLGVDLPQRTLSDFITGKASRIEEVLVPTGVANLSLVSGALDALDVANPRYGPKAKLLRNIRALDVDYVILDLGAGTAPNVLDFFLLADHGILVLVPEPTSVENGYRFIKAAFFRRLQTVQKKYGIQAVVREALTQKQETAIRTPFDVIAAVKARELRAGEDLEREMLKFRPGLIVNQTRTAADQDVGEAVVDAWRKYFGLEMDYLGSIGYDDEVWKAVRKRRPVLLERPEGETAKAIAVVARRVAGLDQTPENAGSTPGGGAPPQGR